MILIDGSHGEGGGQIVRSSLALAMVTGQPVTIENIRARRSKPGLQRQHLTAVHAAREVCGGGVDGAVLGSSRIVFGPGEVRPGEYAFDVGSAGSTTLVLQTILPALMIADAPSQLRLHGGTHNPFAPPFAFLDRVYAPLVDRMGPEIRMDLRRHGFFPAGQGEMYLHVNPSAELGALEIDDRGKLLDQRARALVANLPLHIAQRELDTLRSKLGWKKKHLRTEEVDAAGPGNVVLAELEFEQITELFVGFGKRGVSAERVAGGVAKEVQRYLKSDAPVGEYLADQLLLPLGISAHQGKGGRFRTTELSQHSRTHIEVLREFLSIRIEVRESSDGATEVELTSASI